VVVDGSLRGVIDRRATQMALKAGQPSPIETVAARRAGTPLCEARARLIDSSGQLAVILAEEGVWTCVVGLVTFHDLLRAECFPGSTRNEARVREVGCPGTAGQAPHVADRMRDASTAWW
jgi:hypothetical protein